MPKIMPISVLRDTNEISETCHRIGEPIFITKNGYGDMVVMSVETYERDFVLLEVYRKLLAAEQQMEKGDVMDAEHALESLRGEYGYEV